MTRGNKAHHLTDYVGHVNIAIENHMHLSMRDGVLDPTERFVRDLLHSVKDGITNHIYRDNLSSMIEKGVDPSPYMNDIAHRLKLHVSHFDEEPRGQLTPFPDQHNHG